MKERNARLAVVQVIFQYYFSKTDINKIISEYGKLILIVLAKYDRKLFENSFGCL